MPTNDQLKKSILEIDSSVNLEGKTNVELVALLAASKFVNIGADDATDTVTIHKTPAVGATDADVVIEPVKPPYTVSSGKALTTKRGIIAEGEEIRAVDLTGDQTQLNYWIEKGFIDKNW